MSVFDTIRFPIVDWEQAQRLYHELPKEVQDRYQRWNHARISFADEEVHMAKIREIIAELE